MAAYSLLAMLEAISARRCGFSADDAKALFSASQRQEIKRFPSDAGQQKPVRNEPGGPCLLIISVNPSEACQAAFPRIFDILPRRVSALPLYSKRQHQR